MRLFKNDYVAYDDNGERKIGRVKKITNDLVYLRNPNIALEIKDKSSWAASPKQLQLKNARKIGVDILGRVFDPKQKNENS